MPIANTYCHTYGDGNTNRHCHRKPDAHTARYANAYPNRYYNSDSDFDA
jgi:hypothetical protein